MEDNFNLRTGKQEGSQYSPDPISLNWAHNMGTTQARGLPKVTAIVPEVPICAPMSQICQNSYLN